MPYRIAIILKKLPDFLAVCASLRDTLSIFMTGGLLSMSYQETHNAMIANKERRYPGNNKRQGRRKMNPPT